MFETYGQNDTSQGILPRYLIISAGFVEPLLRINLTVLATSELLPNV
jgi:hypothetical protein